MAHHEDENGVVEIGRECVAILVDGGFYLNRAHYLWGEKSPHDRAEELVSYCNRHLKNHVGTLNTVDRLYRIFYYDCPPSDGNIYNPITQKSTCLKYTAEFKWATTFHELLRSKRKVALRLGHLSKEAYRYSLSPDSTNKLLSGKLKVADIELKHFSTNIVQKGVDMKIGLDVASMAYKHQVTKMILISNDSDFVPAAKLARREGVDFILDNLFCKAPDDLNEHIDGKYSRCVNPHTNPLGAKDDPLAANILHELRCKQ